MVKTIRLLIFVLTVLIFFLGSKEVIASDELYLDQEMAVNNSERLCAMIRWSGEGYPSAPPPLKPGWTYVSDDEQFYSINNNGNIEYCSGDDALCCANRGYLLTSAAQALTQQEARQVLPTITQQAQDLDQIIIQKVLPLILGIVVLSGVLFGLVMSIKKKSSRVL